VIKAISLAVAVLVAAVLLYAATQPDTFRIERAADIKAPPEKIYAILEDFGRAPEWSPFEKKDPNMKRSRRGPPKGVGAVYAFEGNKDVGTGELQVLETNPPSGLRLRLDMKEPFEGSNVIEYTLKPANDTTRVTWSITGPMPFISKVMCLFIDMDKMVGRDFEAGLAALKGVAEKA
jgi:uncharacterized protein YndB with AHSA1/START domain